MTSQGKIYLHLTQRKASIMQQWVKQRELIKPDAFSWPGNMGKNKECQIKY